LQTDEYFAKIPISLFIRFQRTARYLINIGINDPVGSGNTNDQDFTIGFVIIEMPPIIKT